MIRLHLLHGGATISAMKTLSMPPSALVAAELRGELAKRRMKQEDLADGIGRPRSTVARWIGGTTPIKIDDLYLLCDYLELDVPQFLTRVTRRYLASLAA